MENIVTLDDLRETISNLPHEKRKKVLNSFYNQLAQGAGYDFTGEDLWAIFNILKQHGLEVQAEELHRASSSIEKGNPIKAYEYVQKKMPNYYL